MREITLTGCSVKANRCGVSKGSKRVKWAGRIQKALLIFHWSFQHRNIVTMTWPSGVKKLRTNWSSWFRGGLLCVNIVGKCWFIITAVLISTALSLPVSLFKGQPHSTATCWYTEYILSSGGRTYMLINCWPWCFQVKLFSKDTGDAAMQQMTFSVAGSLMLMWWIWGFILFRSTGSPEIH